MKLGTIPSQYDFLRSMTTELDQDLVEVELNTVLMDAVEDSDFSFLDAAGVGAVILCSSPVRLCLVSYFCADPENIYNSDFCFIGFGGTFTSLPSSLAFFDSLLSIKLRYLRPVFPFLCSMKFLGLKGRLILTCL